MVLPLAIGGCGTMSENSVAEYQEAADRLRSGGDIAAEVEMLARHQVDGGHTMGMAVGVLLPDGTRRHFGFGQVSRDDPHPPGAHTVFPIGSLGKLFMAGLVAKLVEEGTWTWDSRLEELLPAGTPMSRDAAEITIRQLATHSSGMPREPLSVSIMWYYLRYLFTGRSFYDHIDTEYMHRYLARFRRPRDFRELDYSCYSNLGYGLLGHLVELRTGEALGEAMRSRITRPLGLDDTGFEPSPGRRRAHGHAGDQPKFMWRHRPVPEWSFTDMMKGAGGLHSTPDDLLRFADAHLDRGNSPLSPLLAANLVVHVQRPVRAQAVGWIVDVVEGEEIVFQMGVVAGYSCYLGLHRRTGTAVVVLQNNLNWRDEVGHSLLLRMVHGLAECPAPD